MVWYAGLTLFHSPFLEIRREDRGRPMPSCRQGQEEIRGGSLPVTHGNLVGMGNGGKRLYTIKTLAQFQRLRLII